MGLIVVGSCEPLLFLDIRDPLILSTFNLLTFRLGHSPVYSDQPALASIVQTTEILQNFWYRPSFSNHVRTMITVAFVYNDAQFRGTSSVVWRLLHCLFNLQPILSALWEILFLSPAVLI